MKKLLFCMLALVCLNNAQGQISLEQAYPGTGNRKFNLINLGKAGTKYVDYNQTTQELKLYNLNHSVFLSTTIVVPPSTSIGIVYIASDLFDCDSSNIELAISYVVSSGSTYYRYFEIVRTNGTVLFHRDSSSVVFTNINPNIATSFIVNTPAGVKMMLSILTATPAYEVYSLCGTIPLSVKKTDGSEDGSFQLSPNPSTFQTRVDYTLPQGVTEGELVITDQLGQMVDVYRVSSQFDHLLLSNADLPAGTYYYQLQVSGNNVLGVKKAIVIK